VACASHRAATAIQPRAREQLPVADGRQVLPRSSNTAPERGAPLAPARPAPVPLPQQGSRQAGGSCSQGWSSSPFGCPHGLRIKATSIRWRSGSLADANHTCSGPGRCRKRSVRRKLASWVRRGWAETASPAAFPSPPQNASSRKIRNRRVRQFRSAHRFELDALTGRSSWSHRPSWLTDSIELNPSDPIPWRCALAKGGRQQQVEPVAQPDSARAPPSRLVCHHSPARINQNGYGRRSGKAQHLALAPPARWRRADAHHPAHPG